MRIGQDMEHNGEHNPCNTRTRGFVHGGECLFQIEEKEVKRRAVIREHATIAEYQCPSRMNTNRAGLRAVVPGQHDATVLHQFWERIQFVHERLLQRWSPFESEVKEENAQQWGYSLKSSWATSEFRVYSTSGLTISSTCEAQKSTKQSMGEL